MDGASAGNRRGTAKDDGEAKGNGAGGGGQGMAESAHEGVVKVRPPGVEGKGGRLERHERIGWLPIGQVVRCHAIGILATVMYPYHFRAIVPFLARLGLRDLEPGTPFYPTLPLLLCICA